MNTVFDYANSIKAATHVCTQEDFERLVNSFRVKQIFADIRAITPAAIPTKDSSEDVKVAYREWKDKVNKLKKDLPVIMPHAHFTDGWRHQESAERNCWMSMDYDGIEDPLNFWKENLEPKVDILRMGLVFISPSGKGVKIIAQCPDGMSIKEAQEWFAEQVGEADFDRQCYDESRCTYLCPKECILLYKPELLFGDPLPTFQVDLPHDGEALNASSNGKAECEEIIKKSPHHGGDAEGRGDLSGAGLYDPTLSLGGILYSDIVAAYFQKKYGGWPEVGHRHAALVSWVNAAFSLICDNDRELMLKVTPRIKPDDEICSIVDNVAQYHSRKFTPYESKLLKQVIAELQAKKAAETATSDEELLEEEMESQLPPLPPPIKILADICPLEFKVPMIMTCLVMFGELLCRFRAKMNAWETEFPGFFYVIEAPMGGGKRFIQIARELILKVAEDNDKAQEEAVNAWDEEKDRHSSDSDYVAPPKPKPVYMIGPNKFSPSELMREAQNNQGVGILSIGEEIDTHTNSNKSGPARDTSDMERIGFDGGMMKQRYAGQGTVYGSAELFLSFIYTGTPNAVDRAFPDAENGLVSRYIYDYIETRFKAKPIFRDLTKKERNIIESYAMKALRTCFDEDGKVMPIQQMKMDWALPAIDKWAEDYLSLAQATRNTALDAFRRRPPKMALRAMMVANWLWGCKKKHRQDVIDFGIWVADHAIDSQMRRFGSSFVEQTKIVEPEKIQSVKACKNDALYNLLPNTFTYEVIAGFTAQLDIATPIKQIIFRLKNKNMIEKIDSNTYRKVM